VDQSFANGGGDGVADERAGEIKNGRHGDGLARCQDLGRDDGGDGVGRIVKAVAVLEDNCRQDDPKEDKHGGTGNRLRVLQGNLQNDVSSVATTIDHFFEEVVEVTEENEVFGVVFAVIKIAQKLELELVGLAFNRLETGVHFAR